MQAHPCMTSKSEEANALAGKAYEPGTVLSGRYRVVRALGEGGMGQVYECEHVEVGRKVAVKVLQPWLADHAVGKRLRVEARSASAAGHPNIVEVLDAGRLEDGRPFLAMEFLDGSTLLDLIQCTARMTIADVAEIGAQVARGLHAAHLAGIVHRDLKPENVMIVERDGKRTVKVVDFGIAFEVDEAKRMTREGVAVGTPQYMAPEQVFGAPGAPTFDVYALGVLLFEMWTGETPFDGNTPVKILEAKTQQTAPRVEEWRPDTAPWLADLIAECLAYDAKGRPDTALEVAERLEQGKASVVAFAATAPTIEAAALPVKRRWGPWMGLGIAAAFAAAATTGLWLSRPQPSPLRSGLALDLPPPVAPPDTVREVEDAPPVESSIEPVEPPSEPEDPPRREAPKPLPSTPEPPASLPTVSAKPEPEPRRPAVARKPDSKCDGVEKRARQARGKHLWQPVLEEVVKKQCWASAAERKKLHVLALKELGRFASCAKVAGGSTDPEIQTWKRLCEKRAE